MENNLKGFYYHYKHDPAGPVNNYAYEFLNVAYNSEIDISDNPNAGKLAMYRPLYRGEWDKGRVANYWTARPFDMFFEEVTKDGRTFPRFKKITDPKIIVELEKIRNEMYAPI